MEHQVLAERARSALASSEKNLRGTDNFTEIKQVDGPSIYYYCCITEYLTEELNGPNKTAISMVVDVDSLENRQNCKVGNLDAIMGELDGQTYLCWTISPQDSCIIAYTLGAVDEEDIFYMAESIAQEE